MKRALAILLAAGFPLACGTNPKATENRGWSDHYEFQITVSPMPPKAEAPNYYRIVVQDKKSGQPIEGGEGQIFATSKDNANVDNGFQKEKEPGMYSARLIFPTGGDWSVAIRFRGDHNPRTSLEKIDWVQAVQEDTTFGPGGGK